MSKEKPKTLTTETALQSFSLTPTSLEEAMKFSEMIANSDLCPKDFLGKPGNVLVAVQMGSEIGLKPMQAIQNIAVINSRPCVWGDALPALAKCHPMFEYIDEAFDEATMTATCRIKRRGEPEQVRTFSKEDAITAGLWKKVGPWTTNPKRMISMRARGFGIRDVFPDALKGLQVAEEAMDIPVKEMGPADVVGPNKDEPVVLELYPEEKLSGNLDAWGKLVASGKKTSGDIINMIKSKFSLTPEQEATIKKITTPEKNNDANT